MMNITDLNKSLAETITPNAIGAASVNEVNKVKNDIGTLSSLQTENKSTIVAAINELLLKIVEQKESDIKQIACGEYHAMMLKKDGTLWACGYNCNGQLGLGDYQDRLVFTQVLDNNINNNVTQVACGQYHTAIITDDGSVWTCGYGHAGQIGLSDSSSLVFQCNNDIFGARSIACGYSHTMAIDYNNELWVCGANSNGQLGLGDTNNRYFFTKNNDIDYPEKVYCAGNYTYILSNTTVYCCGNNSYGQLGQPSNEVPYLTTFTQVLAGIKQIACGLGHVIALNENDSIASTGRNDKGQLGLGDTYNRECFEYVITNINNDVDQVICGQYHTFIIKNDRSLWACGSNNYGQLCTGNNDYENHLIFEQVTGSNINDILNVYGGLQYTFIEKTDGSVFAAGANNYGVLGSNDRAEKDELIQIKQRYKK